MLLEDDGTTVIATLTNAFEIKFLDTYNKLGTGSLSISLLDANAAQCTRNRFITIKSGSLALFSFEIEATSYKAVAGRGQVDRVLTVSGRSWGCVWDETIVDIDPATPDGAPLDPTWRNWWFASSNFISTPQFASWNPPTEVYEYKDGVAAGRRVQRLQSAVDSLTGDPIFDDFPSPVGYPWPLAPHNGDGFAPTPVYVPTYWTIADGTPDEESIGFHFFRGTFLLAGTQSTKFTVTGDNLFMFALQGIPALSEDADSLVWMGWKEVTLELPAGLWYVACAVENIDADVAYNPAGLLFNAIAMAQYPGEVATTETLSLLASNAADWESTFAADFWPGFTPGQILDDFSTESQARGAMPAYAGGSFADFTDSGGGAWDSADPDTELEQVPLLAVRIGETGLKLLDTLQVEGWIDWHFQADTLTLNAWAQGSGGTTAAATFVEGGNIGQDGIEREASRPYANALKVQWAKGHVWVKDTAEIASAGKQVEDVYSTDAATIADAERMGRIELARRTAESRSAIRLAIEPVDAGGADCPYVGFQIGDYVTVPTPTGGTESVQVLTIGMEVDEKGYAKWSLELNLPWLDPDQSRNDLLRALGGKSIGTVRDLGITKM